MVTVLKIRALFEEYGNNALSDENLIEAIDMIEEAMFYRIGSLRSVSQCISAACCYVCRHAKTNRKTGTVKTGKTACLRSNRTSHLGEGVRKSRIKRYFPAPVKIA